MCLLVLKKKQPPAANETLFYVVGHFKRVNSRRSESECNLKTTAGNEIKLEIGIDAQEP